jgi:hypothetical protein
MTVAAFKHNLITPSNLAAFYTQDQWRGNAAVLRDQMRTALTYSGSPWKVSDIAQYNPTTTTDHRGFVWIVRHSSGSEWLFGMAARLNATIGGVYTEWFPAIFRSIRQNTSYTTSVGAHLMMHYNTDFSVATYNMNFTDAVNLTYSGGDFTLLTSPNWPLASGFYPASTLAGSQIYYESPVYSTSPILYRTSTVFVFEDTGPSITAVHYSVQQTGLPTSFCSVGEIIDPIDPLDTGPKRRSGAFGCTITSAMGNASNTSQLVTTFRWARFFNTAGAVIDTSSWTGTGDKNYANDRIFPGGIYTGRPLPLGSSKGTLDSRFFLEAGAINDYARYGTLMRTPANDLLVKANGLCTIPWQTGLDFFAW